MISGASQTMSFITSLTVCHSSSDGLPNLFMLKCDLINEYLRIVSVGSKDPECSSTTNSCPEVLVCRHRSQQKAKVGVSENKIVAVSLRSLPMTYDPPHTSNNTANITRF